MVRPVQNDRAATGRDCAGKSGHTQNCESECRRKPESLIQVQHSRDSGAAFFQERPTARSGHRRYEQEGSAQPAGNTGVTPFRHSERSRGIPAAQTKREFTGSFDFAPLRMTFALTCARRGSNPQPLAPEAKGMLGSMVSVAVLLPKRIDARQTRPNHGASGSAVIQHENSRSAGNTIYQK